MYRFSANSRATISSMAIFLSQQSRQYRSSPRGSETSLAPHSAQRALAMDLRGTGILCLLGGRHVHLLDVLLHHARCAELRRHGADALLDDAQPRMRHAVLVALIVGRHHLLLEQAVERIGIRGVLRLRVVDAFAAVDDPAVRAVETLCPPTVADTQVRNAVD